MLPDSIPLSDGRRVQVSAAPPRQGGQARVYRAELDGRPVAVKFYPKVSRRADDEARILDEIAADDPQAAEWCVAVLGRGLVNGGQFLVLPWLEASLRDWAPGQSLAARLEALVSTAEAVARLHRSKRDLTGYRVHRDIKPDNVLLAWEGRWVARLADLGAAKDGGSLALTQNTGMLTETFAPPEQALPIPQAPRESWDVHALAVTVFWVLTERLPVPALDAPSLLSREGRRLVQLSRREAGSSWSEAEREEYASLRALPVERLLEVEEAAGWRPEDDAHLERALEDAGFGDDERQPLLAPLVAALRGALEPDGRRRDNDVRLLLAALRGLAAATGRASPPPEAAAPVLPLRAALPAPVDRTPDTIQAPRESEVLKRPASALRAAGTPSNAPVPAPTRGSRPLVLASAVGGVFTLVAGAVLLLAGVLAWRFYGSAATGEEAPPAAGLTEAAGGDIPPAEPLAAGAAKPAAAAAMPSASPSTAVLPTRAPAASGAKDRSPSASPIPGSGSPSAGADAGAGAASAPDASPAAEVAAAVRRVTVDACPAEGVEVRVDDGAWGALPGSGFGMRMELTEGPHRFQWRRDGLEHTRELDVGTIKRACHDFAKDGSCGSCPH